MKEVFEEESAGRAGLLGRPWSFWRAALAAGMLAGAVGLVGGRPLAIDNPGSVPLLLAAAALLVAGPHRRLEHHNAREAVLQGLLVAALAWPVVRALSWPPEPEAVLLALPLWFLALAALVLAVRLRQQDADLPALALLFAGVLRLLHGAGDAAFRATELIWWIAAFAWIGGVFVARPAMKRALGGRLPLVAGLAWFVLAITVLVIQEARYPVLHLVQPDRAAAVALIEQRPLVGWGVGAFPRAVLEFSRRPPAEAPFTTVAVLRFTAEMGVLGAGVLAIAFVALFGRSIAARPWCRGRAAAVGALGLWAMALVSSRGEWFVALTMLLFLAPSSLGQPQWEIDPYHPERLPPFAMGPWGLVLALVLAPAVVFPTAKWHYDWQSKRQPIEARSFLRTWSEPLRKQVWEIRDRSPDIMRYADPRDKMRPAIEQWVRIAPHDEFAHIERIRWAHRTLPRREAEMIAREAHERLPWSPAIATWVVRIMQEQGRDQEAVQFMDRLLQEQGTLHPVLRRRYQEIRGEMPGARDGQGN